MKIIGVILHGFMALVGFLLFVVSKKIYLSLPPHSEFAWHFVVLSIVGLLVVIGSCMSYISYDASNQKNKGTP